MTRPKIQLLAFEGCPLAGAARRALEKALAQLGLDGYEEVDLLAPETPEPLRGWGSPTILVDGRDIAGGEPGSAVGCRVYPGADGVPKAADIAAAIDAARRREPAC